MASFLIWFRFCVFVVFVICNAIVCTAGVWNLGLAQPAGYNYQLSVYLAFLGAFGLFCAIPIIFIDVFCTNAMTSRVWFECVWVGLFWVMELSGAAASSATMPRIMCGLNGSAAICVSTKVLSAFTWICSIVLLVYLITLAMCAIIHQAADKQVWYANTRSFAWFATRSTLTSAPASPVSVEKGFGFAAPAHFIRPAPVPLVFEQEITSPPANPILVLKRTKQAHELPGKGQSRPFDHCSPEPMPENTGAHKRLQLPKISTVPSLYPSQVNSAITPSARSSLIRQSISVEPSPTPLREWPRKSGGRRKAPPPPIDISLARRPIIRSERAVMPSTQVSQPRGSRAVR